MKVAVTATEPSADGRVDPRFGRCPFFIIVETDDMSSQAVENPSVTLGGGAGIQSAQLMAEKGVKFVLTGNCGPNAYQTLAAAGIGVIIGCSGTVSEVVEQFKSGGLNAAGEPNVAGHFGLPGATAPGGAPSAGAPGAAAPGAGMPMPGGGAGRGMGRGMGGGGGRGGGMGRGMGGGGRGRGMGAGMGRGRGMATGAGAPQPPLPTPPAAQGPAGGEELALLKQQAEAMSQQMQQIQERIRQLEQEG
jgi:predicted Fe-Mo cluster-binding NifX family protein